MKPGEYITADLHFGHAAMLRPDYCARPFPDVDAMDEHMIRMMRGELDRRARKAGL